MPDFDPIKLKKDLSLFDARLKIINGTFSGKNMIANVKEFAIKTNNINQLDVQVSAKYINAASQTMKFIRLLPESLFSSPDSPLMNQTEWLKNATAPEFNQSILALYLGTKAMLSGTKSNEQDINYLLQSSFGKDFASKSIRDYLLKPFGPDIKIPDFLTDTLGKLERLVREGNSMEMVMQRMRCALQRPAPQKLWDGKIAEVIMYDGACSGMWMNIIIDNYKSDAFLQLILPMSRNNSYIVNVEDEINKKNIEVDINPNGTTSLSLIIPENISSGYIYFTFASSGGNSECMEFWSVFESSRPQINPALGGYYITAGKPVIHSFTIVQSGPIFPRQFIDLNWEVENADALSIEILPVADSPNNDELPQIQIAPTPKGTVHVNITCTRRWKGKYALHATNSNNCGMPEPVTVLLESGWSEYLIGTGMADITDQTPGLGMMGFADELQKAVEIDMLLFSRAFIITKNINQPSSTDRTAIVVADLWSCTQTVKTEVINRLNANPALTSLYNEKNVLITGTHTHSGPGGYSRYFLYNLTCGGFDQHNFDIIVNGIVFSIVKAHNNLAPGRIYKNSGEVDDCGYNRSIDAYNANYNVANFSDATDKEMLLLKFVKDNDGKGNAYPIGILNWYGIHPTSLGQSNTKISGDNKGWASHLFEESKNTNPSATETFIAAFANSCAGDVSGSVDSSGNTIPHDSITDVVNMKALGEKQFNVARDLYDAATEEITGGIDFKYMHVDMSNIIIGNDPSKRTWPAALGISFGAGSTEDGKANVFISELGINIVAPIREGITSTDLTISFISSIAGGTVAALALLAILPEALALITTAETAAASGIGVEAVASEITILLPTIINLGLAVPFFALLPCAVLSELAFEGLLGKLSHNQLPLPHPLPDGSQPPLQIWDLPELDPFNRDPIDTNGALFIEGHSPKPIMLPVGNCRPHPLVPNVVPIQLLKIGQLAIVGVPGEVTTMAGRRLKNSIKNAFRNAINTTAIAAYSNAYSGYITTVEEYNSQQYEGASTLYGPNTLGAYLQEFSTLADAIVSGQSQSVQLGSPVEIDVVELKQRGISPDQLYVINRTSKIVEFKMFRKGDKLYITAFNAPHIHVPANENLLFNLTGIGAPLGSTFQIQINNQPIMIYNVGDPPIIIQ